MKEFNLREELKTLKDKRRGQAQQHKIDVCVNDNNNGNNEWLSRV